MMNHCVAAAAAIRPNENENENELRRLYFPSLLIITILINRKVVSSSPVGQRYVHVCVFLLILPSLRLPLEKRKKTNKQQQKKLKRPLTLLNLRLPFFKEKCIPLRIFAQPLPMMSSYCELQSRLAFFFFNFLILKNCFVPFECVHSLRSERKDRFSDDVNF